MSLKALTLLQPWAQLMADGRKSYETRSWYPWSLKRGELLAITAAARFDYELGVVSAGFGYAPSELSLGHVVAVVRFLEAHKTEHTTVSPEEREYGDYRPGRFAWRTGGVVKLATPVPCRGYQGVWVLPDDVEAAVRAQVALSDDNTAHLQLGSVTTAVGRPACVVLRLTGASS